ncbi:hypothetical protein BKA61DRAFT_21533 [Leptodontidium sp. MPI-SDFR-AT-0119]|nr:hypothetical protein BKA61DRAFT_21533 [Leptodontidium sp. MPI-SDFR-AT-0119]
MHRRLHISDGAPVGAALLYFHISCARLTHLTSSSSLSNLPPLLSYPSLSLSSSSSPLLRIPFRRRRLRACLGIASKEVCVRAYRPCVRANTRSCISCNCFTCPPATKENRTRFPRDDPQHPALQLSTTCSPDTFRSQDSCRYVPYLLHPMNPIMGPNCLIPA